MALRISRGGWAAIAAVIAAAVLAVVLVASLGGGPDRAADGGPTTPPAPAPTGAPGPSATATRTGPATSSPVTAPTATGAAPTVPAGLLGQDLEAIPTQQRVVALTFDAGGNSAGLTSILQTLARERVVGTFFVTGDWAAGDPAGLRAIAAAGHRLGNHSMTHPHFPQLSSAGIRAEVVGTQQVLAGAGADPRPLFRFPFGDRDDRTIAAVNDLGYVAVRWTVDTLGWQGTTEGRSAASVTERAMAALRPGAIVLMHVGSHPQDGSTLDADALPGLIDRLRAAGYGFVTLESLTNPGAPPPGGSP
jgi:peptidoglycan/xylan/chitin deacetylase (PgdA/CDA1 family)